jgi:predicted phage baseplate assembly protein
LLNRYEPATVLIRANVAAATHGERVTEVLGDGDASVAYQRFALKQVPLTFTRAGNDTGKVSTLEIWVNDVKWREVPSLFDRKPDERVYITRLADDGTVTVLFGDGRSGARLPTGVGNIRAVYRKGTGLPGMVRAGQLKTLLTRPLGLREVVSPLPATGAADPEALADARRNAPLTVLTLGRVVSLQDYEDYARAYPGVAKALATWTWSGRLRGVLLTVAMAAPPGGDPTDGTAVIPKLLQALRDFGNPFVPLQVLAFRPAKFEIAGTLRVKPDHDPDQVLAAARKTLGDRYAFPAREFGQPVILSEVIATLQAVDGVEALDIDHLQRMDRTEPEEPAPRLLAEFPAPGAEVGVRPAELLTLVPASLNALRLAP